MKFVANINRRRLWLLLTLTWLGCVFTFYGGDIADRYNASIARKLEIDRSEQEFRFQECLARSGTNWFALVHKHESECAAYAREQCKGSFLCAEEFLAELCIKGKSDQCRDIYFVSVDQIKDLDPISIRWRQERDRIEFYLGSTYAAPLRMALLLAFSVPFLLAVLPGAMRRIWRWLTSG